MLVPTQLAPLPKDATQPHRTFRRIWRAHPHRTFRRSGAVLLIDERCSSGCSVEQRVGCALVVLACNLKSCMHFMWCYGSEQKKSIGRPSRHPYRPPRPLLKPSQELIQEFSMHDFASSVNSLENARKPVWQRSRFDLRIATRPKGRR